MALTPEQRQRVEMNRQAALQRKRALQTCSYCSTTTFSAPCSPSLSQESTASTASSGSCNATTRRRGATTNTRKSLPPLPESAPKLRGNRSIPFEQQLAVIELARPPTASCSDNSNKDTSINDEEVAQHQKEDIEDYLDPAMAWLQSSKNQERDYLRELKGKERAMRELMVFYLYESFMNFCHSKMTLEQLRDESYYKRNWFPRT
eukprot:CCRYP_020516-RA/>CCRYP_020516-RA protein AED:0.26 eAED:0.53 QI:0/0/0/1/0.5/0.33/3/0/204